MRKKSKITLEINWKDYAGERRNFTREELLEIYHKIQTDVQQTRAQLAIA